MPLQSFSADEIREMEQRYRVQFINSLSGFKSVNLVGTVDAQGHTNLSIVNSVVHIGANPPLMGFILRPITVARDTHDNIMATGHYTFNHLTEAMYKQAHQTSARYPADVSEFDATGLTPAFEGDFPAPYVAESPVRIGLKLREKMEIPLNGTLLMIGEIVEVWTNADCIAPDGYVDIEQAGSIACSGLDGYHRTTRLARLSYAKVDREVREV